MIKIIYLFALLSFASFKTAHAEDINVLLHINDKAKIPHLSNNIMFHFSAIPCVYIIKKWVPKLKPISQNIF